MNQDVSRWKNRLVATAASLPTTRELGEQVSRAVAGLVPHDCLHLLGLAPVSGMTAFPMAHQPNAPLAIDQLHGYYDGSDPYRPDVLAGLPVPARTLTGTALLTRHNMATELRMALREQRVLWGVLSIYRECGTSPFDEEAVRRIIALGPALVAMLRAYVQAAPPRPLETAPAPGVILMGADHTVRGLSPEALEWLRRLAPREPPIPVHQAAISVAKEVELMARLPEHAQRSRFCIPAAYAGQWLAVHAQRLDQDGTGDIAVTFGPATGGQLLGTLAVWFGITPRERIVVQHLSTGLAPKHVARLLDVSVHTVNDHLRSVFGKTGAHGRQELLAALNP